MVVSGGRAHTGYGRWMAFIDGENFTIRGEDVARQRDVQLVEGTHYMRGTFLWFPNTRAVFDGAWLTRDWSLDNRGLRLHFYTSVSGDRDKVTAVRKRLRELEFHPEVFLKSGDPQRKAKGVDIALTKDMLAHAFLDNYDAAVLVAGDGDYGPLIREVQRLGKRVYVAFFESSGLNPELPLIADGFHGLDQKLVGSWPAKPTTGGSG